MNCSVLSGCEPQLCCLENSNNQIKNNSTNLGFSHSFSFGTKVLSPSLQAKTNYGKLRMRAICIPTESKESLYDLMGISENVPFSEIKKAYKQLARKYHPDVSPQDCIREYTKRFIMVKEAYDTLSDPQRRSIYDKDLAKRSYNFAFAARNESQYEDIGEWANRWQSQIHELERKSMNNKGKNSRGGRMRKQR